jgi:hypothetical protein
MADTLRIFISHKMPTDTPLAEAIGARLALFGGNQVILSHAGRFRRGDRWRQAIERELDAADWLIFLATGQNEDWGFCLFECGYFSTRMSGRADRPKLLKTFCRRGDPVHAALKEFNALEASVPEVVRLLKEIYVEPPYAIKPDVGEDRLLQTAQEIVGLFEGGERVERNFDVSPSIVFELQVTDATREQLRNGILPPDCPVSGLLDWQRLFGKSIDTGAWLWHDLRSDWPFAEAYEYLLARMILDGLDGKTPAGAIFRAPDSDQLFRMTLRRFERVSGAKHRFHFIAGRVDQPFDLLQAGSTLEETVLYHLVNLSWYFRRRIVDRLYDRILQVRSMKGDPQARAAAQLYEELGRELMLVTAQSIMRNIDNLRVVQRALGPDDPQAMALLDRADTYSDLQKRVFDAMRDGTAGLDRIADDVYAMALQNHEFYGVVASRYAEVAKQLPLPKPPRNAESRAA